MSRTIITGITAAIWLAFANPLVAATHVVELGLGQVIQAKVAAAQTGDLVIIRQQTYVNQTISGSKAIRIVREKNKTVTIGGSLSFSNVNGEMVLRDFILESGGKGSLTLTNCSKFGLENLTKLPEGINLVNSTVVIRDCAFTGNITISGGSKVEIIDSTFSGNLTVTDAATNVFLSGCTINGEASFSKCNWQAHGTTFKKNLVANQCHSKLFRSTVQKAFSHNHSIRNSTKLDCVIFQSTIGRTSGDLLLSKANRTWVTYSTIHHAKQEGGTEAHFIGNQIYVNKAQGNNGILLDGATCETTIANNHFYNGKTGTQIAANNAEVKTLAYSDSDNYRIKKTINLSNLLVDEVRNEIRNEYNNFAALSKMKFFYWDGSNAMSSERYTFSHLFSGKAYANPNPTKLVTKIEVWLASQSKDDNKEAYEKNTTVHGSGQGVLIRNAKKVRLLNNLFRNREENGHCVYALMTPADGLFIRGNALAFFGCGESTP